MPVAPAIAPDPKTLKDFSRLNITRTDLSAAEIETLLVSAREEAFFSSKVQDARLLARMKGNLQTALSLQPGASRSEFIATMRAELGAAPGDSGDLADLGSERRLGLIYDTQIERAYARTSWQRDNSDPEILDEFPCQELLRVESREKPRDWTPRWVAAGGRLYDGRMIARKDDPVWTGISRFRTPYPPFDYGSGMGVQDIDREEAESLGVIASGEVVEPAASQRAYDVEHEWKDLPPDVQAPLADYMKQHFADAVKTIHEKDGTTRIVLNTPLRLQNIENRTGQRARLDALLPSLPDGETFDTFAAAQTGLTDGNGKSITLRLGHLDNSRKKDRTGRKAFLPAALETIRTGTPEPGADGKGNPITKWTKTFSEKGFTRTVTALVNAQGELFNYY